MFFEKLTYEKDIMQAANSEQLYNDTLLGVIYKYKVRTKCIHSNKAFGILPKT